MVGRKFEARFCSGDYPEMSMRFGSLRVRGPLLLVLVAVVGAACGSSGGATCGVAQTCGGDVVGTWKVTSSCLSATPDAFGMTSCPMAPVDLSRFVLTGTTTFRADKTEETTATLSGMFTISFPSSCLAPAGGPVDCAQVTAGLLTKSASADATFSSASCKSGGGGCVCDFTVKPMTMTETDTYVTSGASLTETSSDGTVDVSTYCVSGTTLTEHLEGTKMMGNQGLSGSVTLRKQ
jgi:hypothetical protein